MRITLRTAVLASAAMLTVLLSAAPLAAQNAALTQYEIQGQTTIPGDGVFAPAQIDGGAFDPYGAVPPGPAVDPGGWGEPVYGPIEQRLSVFQGIAFEYTFLPRDSGTDGLGLNEGEIYGTFALPLRYGAAPITFTPGFAVQFWDGPQGFGMPATPDMPARTYSAYLEVGWNPQITEWFRAELAVQPGVHSDFEDVDEDALRIKGSGLGFFRTSQFWEIGLGVIYLDRVDVKLLPAGGVIWTPDADTRWEILFPYPKLAKRFATYGNRDVWWYVGAEYGGDSWQIERTSGAQDQVDYNDYRAFIGLESSPCGDLRGINWLVEIGYVWERELVYRSGGTFDAGDTWMVRAAIKY